MEESRTFYTKGDAYQVLVPVGNHLALLSEGTLAEYYVDEVGVVVGIELVKAGVTAAWRSYIPIGAGIVVKRAEPEPVAPQPQPRRIGEQVKP